MQLQNVYICEGIRTPFGKYGGCLSFLRPDDMAAMIIRHVIENSGLARHPQAIDEVILGNANQSGEDNRNIARMATLLADLPITVPGITVNRLCASGLEAVSMAARMIKCGEAEVVIAGGVESMSRAPFVIPKGETGFSRDAQIYDTTIGWRFVNPNMKKKYGIDSMPETAENVAADFHISREDQDLYAYRSQQKTAQAIDNGFYKDEILPVQIHSKKNGIQVIDQDEHPRRDTTLGKLAKLPTPFRADGNVTAGNSSGINDGAGVMIVASEKAVNQFSLQPKVRIISSCAVGVEPQIMGIGPISAVKKILETNNLSLDDIGVMEINEAFASQTLAVLRGLDIENNNKTEINPNGGSIALGHPLGASGARLAFTLSRYLQVSGKRYGIATLCVGVGQGSAMLLERV